MNEVATVNHIPENPRERFLRHVMEMNSQSTASLIKLKKSRKLGIRLILSDQFSADATDSERCCKRFVKRLKSLTSSM